MKKPILYPRKGIWYAKIWIESDSKYRAQSLAVKVEGVKKRRGEALEKALKIQSEINTSLEKTKDIKKPSSIADMPFLDYVSDFWKPDSEYVRDKALVEKKPISAHYLLACRRHVETKIKEFDGFKDLTVSTLSKAIIRKWKIWMAEQGYSGKTINNAMNVLRVPIKQAFFDEIIPNDPFHGVKSAAHKEKKRGILRPAEIKALLATPVKDARSRLSFYLPLYCSMRMGEVRGLQWGDINDGVIHIRHNWQEIEGLKTCKCGSEGYVPIPGIVAELLNEVYKESPDTSPTGFIMAIKPNHPIARETLWKYFRDELLSIGIDNEKRVERNMVYHSLRHNFVTACRLAGLEIFEIMALSRHKDEKQIKRYADDHAQDAVDVRELGVRLEKSMLPAPDQVATVIDSQSTPASGSMVISASCNGFIQSPTASSHT